MEQATGRPSPRATREPPGKAPTLRETAPRQVGLVQCGGMIFYPDSLPSSSLRLMSESYDSLGYWYNQKEFGTKATFLWYSSKRR